MNTHYDLVIIGAQRKLILLPVTRFCYIAKLRTERRHGKGRVPCQQNDRLCLTAFSAMGTGRSRRVRGGGSDG